MLAAKLPVDALMNHAGFFLPPWPRRGRTNQMPLSRGLHLIKYLIAFPVLFSSTPTLSYNQLLIARTQARRRGWREAGRRVHCVIVRPPGLTAEFLLLGSESPDGFWSNSGCLFVGWHLCPEGTDFVYKRAIMSKSSHPQENTTWHVITL